MDEFLKLTMSGASNVSVPSVLDFAFGYLVSFVGSVILVFGYKKTHSGYSFSSSYLTSLVLTSVIVSLIMTIIGSNIARAFALVGAMSIVRFRNPVKETKDLVFIFASIAVGMAAGTGFYLIAIFFSVVFSITCLVIFNTTLFATNPQVSILSIRGTQARREEFEERAKAMVRKISLLSMSRNPDGGAEGEFVYEVEMGGKSSLSDLYNIVAKDYPDLNVRLLHGKSTVSS